MKKSESTQKYLVLVPHRDVRVELRKYSENMIKSGLKGVYEFPLVTPLVSLSKFLTNEELKRTACLLRAAIGNNIIYTKKTNIVTFSETSRSGEDGGLCPLALFGPQLDLEIPSGIFNGNLKVKRLFSPLTIGTFLIPDFSPDSGKNQKLDESLQDKLKFRAAAVANMYWRPVRIDGKIGYKWKIGKLNWLPKNLFTEQTY